MAGRFLRHMKSQDYIVSHNGYNVSCKLYYEDKKTIHAVVLFGHGFGGHKDNKAAERFAQRALDISKSCCKSVCACCCSLLCICHSIRCI